MASSSRSLARWAGRWWLQPIYFKIRQTCARENRRLEEDVEICTPSARELSDNELTEKTIAIFEESDGTYGLPRVTKNWSIAALPHGRRRVSRLMRWAGIEGCRKYVRKRRSV